MERVRLRWLVEGAVVAALSVILSYLRLWQMPQGGSITLESLPLLLLALWRGPRVGMAAGAISGLLLLVLGGYVVHPVQGVLDYPGAFAMLGIAGFLPRPWWGGFCLGTLGRFCCHVVSGAVFFGSFAPEGSSVWVYSTLYNASFTFPSLLLNLALAALLWPRLRSLSPSAS